MTNTGKILKLCKNYQKKLFVTVLSQTEIETECYLNNFIMLGLELGLGYAVTLCCTLRNILLRKVQKKGGFLFQ